MLIFYLYFFSFSFLSPPVSLSPITLPVSPFPHRTLFRPPHPPTTAPRRSTAHQLSPLTSRLRRNLPESHEMPPEDSRPNGCRAIFRPSCFVLGPPQFNPACGSSQLPRSAAIDLRICSDEVRSEVRL